MNNAGIIEPLTGDDTHDIIDDAVSALAERRHMWIGDDATLIHLLASLIAQAERELPLAVADARANGATWHDIGVLLGTSHIEVELRFDPGSPVADRRWPFDVE